MARTNIATATVTTSAIDMTALLNLVAQGKAFVVIPNEEDAKQFTNLRLVVDNTVKTRKPYDRNKMLNTRLTNMLAKYDIQHISGKGAKKGVVRDKTYNFLLKQMEDKKGFKVNEVLSILHEAGYTEEGRGLKYDIVTGVYDAMPNYNRRCFFENKAKERLVLKLQKMPLTNDFSEKFSAYLAE